MVNMQSINYQKELDKLIDNLIEENKVPKLMLHSCCAPCSSYVIEYLSDFFDITVFYYNPNISEQKEYSHRVEEQKRLINSMPVKHKVNFLEGDYNSEEFLANVQGYEDCLEGGARCAICFKMRLLETAKKAIEYNSDYFATTLTISPLKNSNLINNIGLDIAQRYGLSYLCTDFKKKNGYKRSIELSREYDLYRQNYCGCKFSKMQREKEMSE